MASEKEQQLYIYIYVCIHLGLSNEFVLTAHNLS